MGLADLNTSRWRNSGSHLNGASLDVVAVVVVDVDVDVGVDVGWQIEKRTYD